MSEHKVAFGHSAAGARKAKEWTSTIDAMSKSNKHRRSSNYAEDPTAHPPVGGRITTPAFLSVRLIVGLVVPYRAASCERDQPCR